MEFLKPNFIDDTVQFVVNSNTLLADWVKNPDVRYQYVSQGFNDDNTIASIKINFAATVTASRLGLTGINSKEFRIYYDGVTANALALLSGATTTSVWSSNSETGMFLQYTPVAMTSLTIEMKKTMVANAEKAIGYLVISQERLTFDRLPAAKNYSPIQGSEEVVHRLSNGRTRIQTIGDVWDFQLKLDYVSASMKNSLKTIFEMHTSHIFVPFGTTTSWDKVMRPVVWPAPFDFERYSDNAANTGFEGTINLLETDP